jgi:glucose dehydrogenase
LPQQEFSFDALASRIKYHSLDYHGIFYVASSAHTFPVIAQMHRNIKYIFFSRGNIGNKNQPMAGLFAAVLEGSK